MSCLVSSYLPVYLGRGAHHRRQVGGYAGAGQALVDESQTRVVLFLGRAGDGEVKALGAVELGVDQARGQDAAAQVDDFIGGQVKLVESLLVFEDLAGQRVNPEILFDQTGPAHEPAVGEFGDARSVGGGSFAGHGDCS